MGIVTRSIDLRNIFPNLIIQPWNLNLQGVLINSVDDLSPQAPAIRSWASTAGNVFVNFNNRYPVLGYGYLYTDLALGTPFTHLLTANYTKPLISGDMQSTTASASYAAYRTGTPTAGWTITNLMKFTRLGTDYFFEAIAG